MSKVTDIADIFKTVGQPIITYVERDEGKLERILDDALKEKGQLCLVTGPSKTGKTTLYKRVLQIREETPLIVRCDREITAADIWKKALEAVDFSRLQATTSATSIQTGGEAELSGKLGWKWLAEGAARFKGMITRQTSETDAREMILAAPGPDLLIPILKSTKYVLIIEDFHYLEDQQKVSLFQQWKRFVDNEVSVVVLGTTHRAVDIANSNKDLIGRIAQIDVEQWSLIDLGKICQKGFDYLKAGISSGQKEKIAAEAVGLPIIVQQICLDLFRSKNVSSTESVKKNFSITISEINDSFSRVAQTRYTQFETHYETLIRGPREGARIYRTYELVLACFTLDPISFSLRRKDIEKRLTKLDIETSEIPPAPSLNSTFGAINQFQQKRGLNLLEWIKQKETLYIVEPAFLYYVRWRALKQTMPAQLDLFEQLISKTEIKNRVKDVF